MWLCLWNNIFWKHKLLDYIEVMRTQNRQKNNGKFSVCHAAFISCEIEIIAFSACMYIYILFSWYIFFQVQLQNLKNFLNLLVNLIQLGLVNLNIDELVGYCYVVWHLYSYNVNIAFTLYGTHCPLIALQVFLRKDLLIEYFHMKQKLRRECTNFPFSFMKWSHHNVE